MQSNTIKDFLNCIEEDPKLTELIKGKRVCLCGPSITNIGSNYGEYIDGFDTVCRVNWHITGKNGWDTDLNCDFGKRTDVMFSGFFLKYEYDNIKIMKQDDSLFNCFNKIKYVYFTDPVTLKKYVEDNKDYFQAVSKNMFSDINEFEENLKLLDINYGIINVWLQRVNNLNYMKQFLNLPKENNQASTSSGNHAIQVILRHQPKELFITGMNFANFGKGGLLKDMYVDNGHSRNSMGVSKQKIDTKVWNIHTNRYTLLFFKKIFNEYDNIELDKLLKNFFDNFK
jgi:hypothetical protein|uniref:Uncharacterized protein n=1 Tax=viral metagenome TaxID=1070528 RepID=A0A6C0IX56_9ZZZZ